MSAPQAQLGLGHDRTFESSALGRTVSAKPGSIIAASATAGSRLNDVYISELLSYSLERLRKVSDRLVRLRPG